MSRQRPEDFSQNFVILVQRAYDEGEVKIPLPISEAKALRSNFYHFRKVLKDCEDPFYKITKEIKFFIEGGLTLRRRGLDAPLPEDFEK